MTSFHPVIQIKLNSENFEKENEIKKEKIMKILKVDLKIISYFYLFLHTHLIYLFLYTN